MKVTDSIMVLILFAASKFGVIAFVAALMVACIIAAVSTCVELTKESK